MDHRQVILARSPFEQNVPHLAEQILSYLSTNDVKQCRLVSKDWNNAASKLLWIRTEIRGWYKTSKKSLNLIKNASSDKCLFNFNFRSTDKPGTSGGIPKFLLNPSVINLVAAVTLNIHSAQVIRQLLTDLPNLKSLKAKVDVSKKLKPKPAHIDDNISCVQSLELELVLQTASKYPKKKILVQILDLCANLKELVLRNGVGCTKDLIRIDNVLEALPYPSRLNRLKLCRWNPTIFIRPSDLVALTRFPNLQEVDLLEWGQFSINECIQAIAANPLPPTWTSLKLSFHYDGIPDVLLLPAMQAAGLVFGSHLKHLTIQAKQKGLQDANKTWSEVWNWIEGKLELTAADVISLCYRTDFLNMTSYKWLERVTWNVCWATFSGVISATPSSVRHLNVNLVVHQVRELEDIQLEKEDIRKDLKTLPNLETFTVKVLGPLQLRMGVNARRVLDGIQFNFVA